MENFRNYFDKRVNEDSTADAKKTLDAIIGFLNKQDDNKTQKEMLEFALGIFDYYKENKSFSPKQAQWIFNTSKSLFESNSEFKGGLLNENKSKSKYNLYYDYPEFDGLIDELFKVVKKIKNYDDGDYKQAIKVINSIK